nr:hypothetical protein [Tanacetum cinerariifolium]
MKGITREFSVPRTPQQNRIAERKNRTLIEDARTMLADSLLPIPFWAEAVNTACYVQNKTPYELLLGRTPSIGFMRPFGYPVTILNTLGPLGKFDAKADEGFLVGYYMFDIDTLIKSMNYQPVTVDNQSNPSVGVQEQFDAEKAGEENVQQYVLFLCSAKTKKHDNKTKREVKGKSPVELSTGYRNSSAKFKDFSDNNINEVNAAGTPVPTVGQISTNSTNTFSATGLSNTIEEGIDYKEVFTPVARIKAIRLFLAYASFMGFMVYQMDVKSAFLYGTIKEEVYVCQPPGFKDPDYPYKVCKVVTTLYGLHQAPRAWYETLANYLLENGFQRGKKDQTLFIKKQKVKQKPDGIFISQDKYVAEILKKFGLIDGKSASTPIDTKKPLLKDPDGEDVDMHTYKSMTGLLMYLTSLRPDIMFVVCACALFQVTPKASHLHAVKRTFRYLKGKPHLGLWYPKDSPFNVVAYSDSDYAGVSLDKKSTTGGCQFLGCRLISWQCKKQIVVATSSTEAKYVAATSCCTQVLWIQNQLLDYGKKVIISEATVQEALQLDNTESIDCLPNVEIFIELSRKGVGKGFFEVETPLFESMIVAQQADDVADEVAAGVDVDDILAADAEPTLPSPPQQQQPSHPTHDAKISLDLLHTLLETCTTLTGKVEALEQDKVAQALEIIMLKHMVKKLERKNKLKVSGLRRLRKTAEIEKDADVQGRPKVSQAQTYQIDLEHTDNVLSMQDDELEPVELKEVVEVVTTAKLMTKVVTAAAATITAATTPITAATTPITAATITTAPSAARRRK